MATTIEELVVKLEAENKQFLQAMLQSSAQTQKSMDAMTAAVADMAKSGEKDVSFFQSSMETMTGFLAGTVVTAAFNTVTDAASKLFNTLVVDGVGASSEAIDNMNRLNFALAQTGQYTKAGSDGLAEWAGELQKTTKYEDDAIIKSAAFIQTLGKLDNDGLKKATEAAMNLSSALGIDLETATRMVGKAAAGEVAAFGKLGIEIQEGSSKAQTFSNALAAISKLGNAAQKEAESYSGALARMGHMFGENQEAIGGLITKNVAVTSVMGAVSKIFGEVSDAINDNALYLRTLVAQGLVVAIDAATLFVASLDQIIRVGTSVFNGLLTVAIGGLTPIGKAMNALGLMSDETWNGMWDAAVKSSEGIVTAFTDDSTMGAIGVKLAEIGNAARGGLEQVATGATNATEVINKTKVSTDEMTSSMKALITEGENLAKQYAEAAISGKAIAEQQIADAQMVRDEKIMAMNAEREARTFDLSTIEEKNAEELAIQQEFFTAKAEANLTAMEAELEAVGAAREANKIGEEELQASIAGIRKKYSDLERKDQGDLAKFKQTMMTNEVKDREAQIGVLAGLQSSQNAYAKTVGKGFAVANTFIKTQEGAQAAYSALAGIPFIGPALGAAAAAAVIADGAARISAIRGAATGITEVPGIGSRDTFGPVALAPGERVVPGETNQDLKAAIDQILSGGGTGGGVVVEVHLSTKEGFMDWIDTQIVQRNRIGIGLQGA